MLSEKGGQINGWPQYRLSIVDIALKQVKIRNVVFERNMLRIKFSEVRRAGQESGKTDFIQNYYKKGDLSTRLNSEYSTGNWGSQPRSRYRQWRDND